MTQNNNTENLPEKVDEQNMVKYNANAIVGTQNQLKGLLNTPSMREAIHDLAPKHLKPEKLIRMILSAASRNPKILECTQSSILKSAIEATMLGLDCSGLLGRGYMVPYRNNKTNTYEAQFMPGYLGLVDLARRSGEIEDITATAVFEGDFFEYEEGLNRKLIHRPTCDPGQVREKETLVWVYAVAEFKSGYKKFHVMPKAEIEKHRSRSKAKDSGPWVSDYIPMALKTVVRQICKFLPQSVDLQSMLEKEYEVDSSDDWGTKHLNSQELETTNGRKPFGFINSNIEPQESEQAQTETEPGDSPKGNATGNTPDGDEPASESEKDEIWWICRKHNNAFTDEEKPEDGLCPECYAKLEEYNPAEELRKSKGKKKSA